MPALGLRQSGKWPIPCITRCRSHSFTPRSTPLDTCLSSAGQAEDADGDEDGFQLNIANAIWGQEGFEFLPEFLDTLAENYGAGLRTLDFAADPEEARTHDQQLGE